MSRVFFVGDTHFGHKNIIQYEAARREFATIEEHDRALVERWNAVVTKRDVVWHLGDVFFGKESHEILGELAGTKRLVLGNHDSYPLEIYQRYFSRIYGATTYRGCLLTHIPCHESQFERYRKNIHGHLHGKKLEDERYVCVSMEHFGLAPVLAEQVLS